MRNISFIIQPILNNDPKDQSARVAVKKIYVEQILLSQLFISDPQSC